MVRTLIGGNFADQPVLKPTRDSIDAILWWEKRRIIFNLALLAAGAITVIIIELVGARYANPGEDIEEPIAVILGGIAYVAGANACYTLG